VFTTLKAAAPHSRAGGFHFCTRASSLFLAE